MDKKGEPKSIRFRIHTELKIEEIAIAEGRDFTKIVEMLVEYGLHEYDFIKKNFTIAPRISND